MDTAPSGNSIVSTKIVIYLLSASPSQSFEVEDNTYILHDFSKAICSSLVSARWNIFNVKVDLSRDALFRTLKELLEDGAKTLSLEVLMEKQLKHWIT